MGDSRREGGDRVRVPVPANPFVPDRIAFGLSARQLAILAVSGTTVWAAFLILSQRFSLPAVAVICAPLTAAALLLIASTPDGIPMDRYVREALRHLISPKTNVLATSGSLPRALGVIDMGVKGFLQGGFVALKDGSKAALISATGINLHLRSEEERAAATESFGRLLNSLESPVQFLVSSSRISAGEMVSLLNANAPYLPHPSLTSSCRDFTAFFEDLVRTQGVLRHKMIVCVKERGGDDAEARLLRRCEHFASQLRGIGVKAERAREDQCRLLVIEALDPDAAPPITNEEMIAPPEES